MSDQVRSGVSEKSGQSFCMNLEELRSIICRCKYCGEYSKCEYLTYPNRPVIVLPTYGVIPHTLGSMLEVSGLNRFRPYILPIVKCDIMARDKTLKACSPFIRMEISILQPLYIIVYGREYERYLEGVTALYIRNVESDPRGVPEALSSLKELYKDVKDRRLSESS